MVWPNGSASRPAISSGFAPSRRHPVTGVIQPHRGTDFVGFSRVCAISPGRVVRVGTPAGWSGGGNQVWIQHNGFFTRSLHLLSPNISVGQWVEEGQFIGVMGKTGTATGVHLHLELTPGQVHASNSGQVDPVAFIQTPGTPAGGGSTNIPRQGDDDMPSEAWLNGLGQSIIDQVRANTDAAGQSIVNQVQRNTDLAGQSIIEQVQRNTDLAGAAVIQQLADKLGLLPAQVWDTPLQAIDKNGEPVVRNGAPVVFRARDFLASIDGKVSALPKA